MRRVALLATVLTTLLALSGCGSDDPDPDSGSGSTDSGRIEVTFEGDEAPEVQRVPVAVGEKVEIVIKSDQPGELHVHSDPEEELDYEEGTTTLTVTIDQPGVVDIERHEPEALVLQLEVS
ncbi:hypothetical protein GCM10009623_08830 [Nocardioides aestuarii]|uniref:EfeO-type cupredoxin-like domain-containing protein n=1 Tax=Nocardioides aestuarii TaxID=252231 RepID=A0ABW4TFR7_9ACTN